MLDIIRLRTERDTTSAMAYLSCPEQRKAGLYESGFYVQDARQHSARYRFDHRYNNGIAELFVGLRVRDDNLEAITIRPVKPHQTRAFPRCEPAGIFSTAPINQNLRAIGMRRPHGPCNTRSSGSRFLNRHHGARNRIFSAGD
jgi:hypothetical protein